MSKKILWLLIVLSMLFSIPWFYPEKKVDPFIFGLPSWAFLSLMMSILFAICTALLILKEWKE